MLAAIARGSWLRVRQATRERKRPTTLEAVWPFLANSRPDGRATA
jgi:hypothetical protein